MYSNGFASGSTIRLHKPGGNDWIGLRTSTRGRGRSVASVSSVLRTSSATEPPYPRASAGGGVVKITKRLRRAYARNGSWRLHRSPSHCASQAICPAPPFKEALMIEYSLATYCTVTAASGVAEHTVALARTSIPNALLRTPSWQRCQCHCCTPRWEASATYRGTWAGTCKELA